MKIINLSMGKETILDDEDYEKYKNLSLCVVQKELGRFYAIHPILIPREQRISKAKTRHGYIHREIMGCYKGDGKIVDHINGNTLDNRRCNLRFVTPSQHAQNICGFSKDHPKGVCFDKSRNKWKAEIRVNKKRIHIGRYETQQEALEAYKEASFKYHGDYSFYKRGGEQVENQLELSPMAAPSTVE
jgi:hypothetical protein